jgi:hypothetical protein
MSIQLEYGNIIKIISSNSTYDDKYFFVERLYDDKLVLVSDTEVTLGITDQELDDASIIEIKIVYKPTHGFISQHKFFIDQWIEIEYQRNPDEGAGDSDKVIGKIIFIEKDILHVKVGEDVFYIPLHRGLPKEILNIKQIQHKEKKEKEEYQVEDGLLDVLEEEVDVEEQFFYSIEQQKNDFLENVLMYIPVEKRTPKQLKKIYKMINRYIELRDKYTTFSDGIYVNHLHYEQIFQSTVSMQNRMYIPITKNIQVRLSETDLEKPSFFKASDDDWKEAIGQLKDNVPFKRLTDAYETFDPYIYHSKVKNNQIKVNVDRNKDELKDAYIIDGDIMYPVIADKSFVVDSFLGHPNFYINYSKVNLERSFLMKKSQFSIHPYYPFIYDTTESSKFECNDTKVIYKNKEETFDTYVKKIIPTLKEYIECSDTYFVNMIDVLNEMNVLRIDELNATNHTIVTQSIDKSVQKIVQNVLKTRAGYLKKQEKYTIIENQQIMDIRNEYEYLSKLKEFYTTSEIFKMTEIDLYKLLTFHYSIKNDVLQKSTEAEIAEIIEEIKVEKDKPLGERINKIYQVEEQREGDNYKIITQDVQTAPDVFISAIELLHRELVATKEFSHGLDEFIDKVNLLLENGMKYDPKIIPNSKTFKKIKEYLIQHKVVKGDIAFVQKTSKKYIWDGEKWIDFKEDINSGKKLVTVKGEVDPTKLEEEYNKKIVELIKNIEKDKLKVKELREFYNEENRKELKIRLKQLIKKKLAHQIKYNTEKLMLEKEELGNKSGVLESPHEKLRDKILNVYQLDVKYKAIQIFIEKYCKRTKDPYWYYCIDTNVKLLPSFFQKMATAYLITNNYENVTEQICLDQGAISDNGDKWVDKYSGYIIKNIEFDYDEGYTETGFKYISRGVIENQVEKEEEDPIMNSIRAIVKYSGLSEVDDSDLEWIHTHVRISVSRASRTTKEKTATNSLYVIAIVSVVLVYIQTLKIIKFIKPFPNCKLSFDGFPLKPDNTNGIKYMSCILFKMEKPDLPFSSVRRMKLDEIEKAMHDFISKFLVNNPEINEKLIERSMYKEEPIEIIPYSTWKLFLPRLKPFTPVVYENIGQTYDDIMYYLSFIIQHKINKHVSTQPPILINHTQTPYLMNTCCNEENNTHLYFLTKDPSIGDDLTEIRKLHKLNKQLQRRLAHPFLFSGENTKKVIIPITSKLEEETLFLGLIHLLNFDNSLPIPVTLTKFGITKPEHYNKNDDLKLKIRKLKEHGYDITEEMLYDMLQSSAIMIRKNGNRKEEEEQEIDDPLFPLDDPKIKNKVYAMTTRMNEECNRIAKTKDYELCLSMEFKSEKRSLTVPVEIEHFTYMYQVLYNKIQSLINFAQMVSSSKNVEDATCEHWKLSSFHYSDIDEFVNSYYTPLKGFFKNEELRRTLDDLPLDKYTKMLKITQLSIKDPEVKFLVYKYIFVSIYHLYLTSGKKIVRQYLDAITSLFNKENKRALNFDLTTIKYEVKISKKSEAEIKKTYFSKLGKDELVSENTMKNLKLGKWGVGLQKSMFEYDKDTYLQDKMAANEVVEMINSESNIEAIPGTAADADAEIERIETFEPLEDEYAIMPEDDDYGEVDGVEFDGDEAY